ncbi:MAG: ABC transporter ATP-binding protein [Bacteroidales bacterium]|jgi:putative ABC transport system ATP-binding protein|nr:ABC transporter ATP-binding protein [Bacteroidales bacterium]
MILQGKKILKQYRHNGGVINALDQVSFTVQKGDFVTVTGPSGSGKSTLLLALFGLIRLTSGNIIFDGKRIDNISDRKLTDIRKKSVGYILQSFALIPYLTTIQNVMIPLALEKILHKEQVKRASEILDYIGLSDRMDHLPRELSAGQQQRVAIARSIIHRPQIIMADEPTGNLDPTLSLEILEFLKKINQENKITIMMVTHSPVAAGYGTMKLHLNEGKIIGS